MNQRERNHSVCKKNVNLSNVMYIIVTQKKTNYSREKEEKKK